MDSIPTRRVMSSRDSTELFTRGGISSVVHLVFTEHLPGLDGPTVVNWMHDRLRCAPVFASRIRRTPFDLASPQWVTVPSVDVEQHVTVREEMSWATAQAHIARLVSTHVDVSRPPWDLTVFSGVRDIGPGFPAITTVVALRTHHAAGDGMHVADVLRRMMTENPQVGDAAPLGAARPSRHATAPWQLARLARAIPEASRLGERISREVTTPEPFDTRLNHPVEGPIAVDFSQTSLPAVRRAIGTVPGAKVNDAALTVIGGALGDTLRDLDGTDVSRLHAVVPVQAEGPEGAMNSFTQVAVPLFADIADPATRLARITAATTQMKAQQASEDFRRLRELQALVPPVVQHVTEWPSRLGVVHRPTPTAVSLISNIPSGLVDATFLGSPLIDQISWLNPHEGLGIQHQVTSFEDRLTIGITVDTAALPDPDDYVRRLDWHFDTLLAACRV